MPVTTHKPASDQQLHDWLLEQASQSTLRFITCGSVDDGKSTLIGRLLWESQQLFDDQVAMLKVDSRRYGAKGDDIDLALLVDGLAAEREQGITIDVAYRFFATSRRKFIVADTPGHEQYTRNMITGASTADVAVILVNAQQGVLTQTRRHARLVALMGVRHVVLAINKMDTVAYEQQVFKDIKQVFGQLALELGFVTTTAIPVSARVGDNVTTRSANTPWYKGPTLMGYLETITPEIAEHTTPVLPVQWVSRAAAEFRGLSGMLVGGSLQLGDTVRVTASGQTAAISGLLDAGREATRVASGDAVTVLLDREIDASRGDVLTLADAPLDMTDQFEATLIWLHEDSGLVGRAYELKLATQWSGASITVIKHGIDVDSGALEPCRQLELNDIAVCNVSLSRPLVFAPYAERRELGSFLLVDKFTRATVAAGLIHHNLRRAQNVHRQALHVGRPERERLNGHAGKVLWFTGLSGSGKSTLANALEQELYRQGKRTYVLDGDNIRQGLNKDLGFTDADRVENIRRVAEVARLMLDAGLIVMTAFISPFRAERQMARELIGEDNFIEVYVDTPLEECERRDPKGLYKKARRGELPNMTGIGSPYEPPLQAELVLDTHELDVEHAVDQLLRLLHHVVE